MKKWLLSLTLLLVMGVLAACGGDSEGISSWEKKKKSLLVTFQILIMHLQW